ncbi:MAG: hypothetical protein ABIL58_05970, partial [Pseudomonadota bacterium]
GFSTAPPAIRVASAPTLLLFVNGQPVLTEVAGTGLQVVANANWPTFKDPAGKGTFYLLGGVGDILKFSTSSLQLLQSACPA